MATTNINRVINLFTDAFGALSVKVPVAEVERLAMLVQHSMDHGRRVYHTSAHLFEMCQGMNPRQTLATLFHDVVYYQLDDGFPRLAASILKPVVRLKKEALVLQPMEPGDTPLAICAGVFGFKAGQTLPLYGGMNEFLSAVVATRSSEPLTPLNAAWLFRTAVAGRLIAWAAPCAGRRKGASPDELPVEEPTKLELRVNVRTAKTLRISIPKEILMRADKVIE